jgi:hypothetical protein
MAGEGDAERLVVLLEARTNDALKAMERAEKKFDGTYAGMRKGSKTATQQMEADMTRTTSHINRAIEATSVKVSSFGKNLVAGFVGGLVAGGVAGVVSRLGDIAGAVASIGDEARRAGVDIKAFQELRYVAEQNRISVSALTDGMKELNLRADEWIVTGGGAAAEAFKRLGYTAEDLNTKLQDPSALLSEIIGKVQGLDRAARIRVFDELFGGTGGEQFVQLISQGEDGIRRTVEEANRLGLVLSEEVIAKAAEVDRKFNMIANTVGTAVKGAIVEAASALNDFLNSLGQTPGQHFAEMEGRVKALRGEIEQYLEAAKRQAPELEPAIRSIVRALEDETMTTEEATAALRELGAQNLEAFPITAGISGVISLMEHLTGKAREAAEAVAAATRDDIGSGASPQAFQDTFFPKPKTKPGSDRSTGTSEIERQEKALKNLISGLEFERELIGLSALDQEKLAALRAAGSVATEDQKVRITGLIEAITSEQAAAQLLMEDQSPWDALATNMAGLDSLLERGAISWEQYGQAAAKAHALAADATLDSLGQITGALSGAFQESKALAVANAVVNTAQGVTKALAQGGMFAIPIAAAIGAAGAAQIATIMSASPGGGVSGSRAPSLPAMQNEPQRQASERSPERIEFTFHGVDKNKSISGEEFEAFATWLEKQSRDGRIYNFKVQR